MEKKSLFNLRGPSKILANEKKTIILLVSEIPVYLFGGQFHYLTRLLTPLAITSRPAHNSSLVLK